MLIALCALGACDRKQVVAGFPDSFVGVGLELRIVDDTPVVMRVLSGGPAEGAGLVPGDKLMEIDGQPTHGQSLGDVVMRLRGAPESQVSLTLQRGSSRIVAVVRRRAMAKTKSDYQPSN